jgi:chemotaxis protein histidine kinase CheA
MGNMSAIVTEFVEEGNEKADQLERQLILLEKSPGSQDLMIEVFRALHTIKRSDQLSRLHKTLCTCPHWRKFTGSYAQRHYGNQSRNYHCATFSGGCDS